MGQHAQEIGEDVFGQLGRSDEEGGERGEREDDRRGVRRGLQVFLEEIVCEQEDLCTRAIANAGTEVTYLFLKEPARAHALQHVERVFQDGWITQHLEVHQLQDGSGLDLEVCAFDLEGDLLECTLDDRFFILVTAQGLDEASQRLAEQVRHVHV